MGRLFLLAIGVSLLLAACTEERAAGPFEPPEVPDIMPLGVGNVWKGEVDGNGPHSYDFLISSSTDSLEIYGEIQIEGRTWYKIRFNGMYEGPVLGIFADGLYLRADSATAAIRLVKYPTHVGDTLHKVRATFYLPTGKPFPVNLYSIVTDVEKDITVPAGTFKCYCARWDVRDLEGNPVPESLNIITGNTTCYSPGVGPVYDDGPPWKLKEVVGF